MKTKPNWLHCRENQTTVNTLSCKTKPNQEQSRTPNQKALARPKCWPFQWRNATAAPSCCVYRRVQENATNNVGNKIGSLHVKNVPSRLSSSLYQTKAEANPKQNKIKPKPHQTQTKSNLNHTKPSQAKPSQAKSSQAKSNQNQTKPHQTKQTKTKPNEPKNKLQEQPPQTKKLSHGQVLALPVKECHGSL